MCRSSSARQQSGDDEEHLSRFPRIVDSLRQRSGRQRLGAVCVLCAAMAMALPAQTFTTLFTFDGRNGLSPLGALVNGANGDGYGTTYGGGASGHGTIFKITPNGRLTTLYSFCSESGCTDGANPYGGLVQSANGDLYGTTYQGGAACDCGTVFKITQAGTLTTLHSFAVTDGAYPYAALVLATNGYLYGTTEYGGAYCAPTGCGTVFKISPDGALTTLHSFCSESGCRDGEHPYAGLVQATNLDGYGTTTGGGATGHGTVFRITGAGALTTLYSFTGGTDGGDPVAGLVQATNGNFYGTTEYGGAGACAPVGCGTVFEITPNGTLTTLYSFCFERGCQDGESPGADLIQATDGNLYGTTNLGGASEVGTVFKITPGGTLTTLYSFTAGPGGGNPVAGLVQATNGDFYGTAEDGASDDGIIFSLSVGLGPFVTTLPTSGDVGSPITILGSDLTGATSVSFNGTPAVFDVVSATEITTTVPSGATTGTVQVATQSGTLSSNVPFRVQ
jgi:uncharacterized repeat protein (TIGR03803 family)